jgi:hypothetical protein
MDTYEEYSEEEKLVGLARDTDPDTSHEAAEKLDTSKLLGTIYGIVAKYGDKGCIGEQVIQALPHIRPQSISPRFSQMIAMGMLEDTRERRVAGSGYLQIVRRIKLPPFMGQYKKYPTSGIALALLRDFPENGNIEAWNLERKQFLGEQ